MLNHLKKLFSATAEQPVASATQPEEVVMTTKEGQSAGAIDTAELSAQLASATESLSVAQSQFAELTAKFAEAQAQLAAIEADKASLVAQAAAKVQATRQEKLTAIMGTEKAPNVAAALAALDDATFETVLGTYASSYEKEATSFKEVGVSAEAAPVEQDPVQKLAAALAAQFKTK